MKCPLCKSEVKTELKPSEECECKSSHLSVPGDISTARCVYCGKPPVKPQAELPPKDVLWDGWFVCPDCGIKYKGEHYCRVSPPQYCTCKDPDVITARQDEHKEYCKECGKEVKRGEIEELEIKWFPNDTRALLNYAVSKFNELIRLLKRKELI